MINSAAPTPPPLLSNPVKCKGFRTDGQLCGAYATRDGYCYWHSAAMRSAMLETSRRGGSHRGFILPVGKPLTSRQARGLLASLLSALLAGAIDTDVARSGAYIISIDRKICETEELEARLSALESRMEGEQHELERPPG